MKLSAYWAGCDNFGDKLTDAIFSAAGVEVYWDELSYAKVCGAGSILNRVVAPPTRSYNYPIYVFGTGFNSGKAQIGTFRRKLKIYAVRGKCTKAYIERIYNEKMSDSVVLGDIGLLSGKLLENKEITKKYDLGIVPHYIDEYDIRFKHLSDRYPNSKILSVRGGVNEFVRELMECQYVISTAMHPLIACDALRIPNVWAFLPNANQADMSTKFNDYYSVFGKEKEALVLDEQGLQSDLFNIIEKNYDITDGMIESKVQELEFSFNKMLEDMKQDRMQDIYWRCISKGDKRLQAYRGALKKYVGGKITK